MGGVRGGKRRGLGVGGKGVAWGVMGGGERVWRDMGGEVSGVN